MRILACDTATSILSVALCDGNRLAAEWTAESGRRHAEQLPGLVDRCLSDCGRTLNEVELLAVSIGPGSFTGLRIALGTIKGLAFAAGKPCVAVPTLEAVSFGARPCERVAVPVLDARRGRVYCAAFEINNEPLRLLEDAVMTYTELGAALEGKRVFFIGDAAEICYNELNKTLDCVCAPPERALPRASWVAYAAAARIAKGQTCSAGELAASYLQLSQAERVLRERENKGE